MSESCPRCGAAFDDFTLSGRSVYGCGSIEDKYQTPECRVRELTAENERLRAEADSHQDLLWKIAYAIGLDSEATAAELLAKANALASPSGGR